MSAKGSFANMSPEARASLTERLREVVDMIGSQAKAATVAEMSVRQMKNYVAGKAAPPVAVLMRLAAVSGTNLEWIIGGNGAKMCPDGIRAARGGTGRDLMVLARSGKGRAALAKEDPELSRQVEEIERRGREQLAEALANAGSFEQILVASGALQHLKRLRPATDAELDEAALALGDIVCTSPPARWGERMHVAAEALRLAAEHVTGPVGAPRKAPG